MANLVCTLKKTLLQRRVQVLCCALLSGSCSDEEASVRAAAVRALAMTVMYKTLREVWKFASLIIYFFIHCPFKAQGQFLWSFAMSIRLSSVA